MNCKSLDEFYELSKEIISYKNCAIKKHLYRTAYQFVEEYEYVKMIINIPFRELFKSKEKKHIIKYGNLYLENTKQSPDIHDNLKKLKRIIKMIHKK
jgi:hypothetical protein